MHAWPDFLASKPVDTRIEIGAYEHLWQQPNTSTKRIAELFEAHPLPSGGGGCQLVLEGLVRPRMIPRYLTAVFKLRPTRRKAAALERVRAQAEVNFWAIVDAVKDRKERKEGQRELSREEFCD